MSSSAATSQKSNEISFFPLIVCLVIGLSIWLLGHPDQVTPQGWRLFAIFIATIVAVIIKPAPIGTVIIVSLTTLLLTNTLDLKQALSGYTDPVVWLVVMAFFISKSFIITGLGNRIALWFASKLGKSALGLSYGMLVTDLVMAPAIPSATARSAGIILPIIQGLSRSYGSHPNDPSSSKIGKFLVLISFQGTAITSAMFLTAMAANPIIASLASKNGIEITWIIWAKAAFVPGIISLLLLPLIIMKLYPPTLKHTPNAPSEALEKLKEMGKITKNEWLTMAALAILLFLWILGKSLFGMDTLTAAMIGLCILLLSQVLTWKQLVHEHSAWETFFWFGALLMMANHLNKFDIIEWLSSYSVGYLNGVNWKVGFPILGLVYFYSHYLFASSTAHILAMFVSFLTVSVQLGTPPMLAALVLAFFSNLFGGLTQYTFSPGPLLYGAGYTSIKEWWITGFIVSVINIIIWVSVGLVWWKILGLY